MIPIKVEDADVNVDVEGAASHGTFRGETG